MLNKKYIALFLVLAMFVVLVAGCGSQSTKTSDKTISEDTNDTNEGAVENAESTEKKLL